MARTLPVDNKNSNFDTLMMRESMPLYGAYAALTAGGSGFTANQSLGGAQVPAGQAWFVDNVIMSSTDVLDLQLQFAPTAITPAAVIKPVYRFQCAAGSPLVIPIRRLFQEGCTFSFVNTSAAGSASSRFEFGLQGYRVANDLAYESSKTIMVVGDSIDSGTGVAYGEQIYHFKLRDELISQGITTRVIMKSQGSFDSTHTEALRAYGMLNVEHADLILYKLGTNDTSATAYANTNLPAFIAWKKKRFPRATLIVLGPPPRQGAVDASVLDPIRAAGFAAVTAAADAKIYYCSLKNSFSTADDTYFMTTDGTTNTTRVHPNVAGHAAMFNTLNAFITANGIIL